MAASKFLIYCGRKSTEYTEEYCHVVWVTVDGVLDWIYWPFYHTTRNYA
jgi:hypothetical protein